MLLHEQLALQLARERAETLRRDYRAGPRAPLRRRLGLALVAAGHRLAGTEVELVPATELYTAPACAGADLFRGVREAAGSVQTAARSA